MGVDESKRDETAVQHADDDQGESQKKKLKYPRAIPFIVGNEFCERFTYYGMRTILVLYLSKELGFSHDDSTVIFHIFTMLVYFMCVPGAVIADSWLGKFTTILTLSCVYVVGSVLVSLTAIEDLKIPQVEITMLGLALIALGSGGIKPCVAAFGGDQFKLPEQAKQAAIFFSIFYFSVNSGSLVSTTVTPILREDVHCFGKDSCYSLAFGVPAVLMCISIVIFIVGRPLYKIKPAAGNMLMKVSKAIGNAISMRWKRSKVDEPKEHWLDYAEPKYGSQLVADIKVLLRVLVLYIPLPLFWALFDQQGSRWTLQATKMDGTLGSIVIKPDQMQLVNPFLILTFIPLYEALFYPLLAKIGIRRPLQKLFLGGVLAGVAFCLSGVVELEIEKTIPSAGKYNWNIINDQNCMYRIETDNPYIGNVDVGPHYTLGWKALDLDDESNGFMMNVTSDVIGCSSLFNQKVMPISGMSMDYILKANENGELMPELKEGGSGDKVHMLWLLPQYIIMTLGEVMFSVTGLEFSYSQAPVSMKSVLQACWLLTVAFGNVIVVIVSEAKFFDSQAHEFFLFAGLMFVDMFIFAIMAYRYKSNAPPQSESESVATTSAGDTQDSQDKKY